MMQYKLFSADRFSFFSLSSGSCGNCSYLGNSHYGILIDAGIGPRIIKKRLAEYGIELSSIQAILITHDHYDHIKSAAYLGEKMHIPVFATPKVHRGIINNRLIRHSLNGATKYIEKGKTFYIADFSITPFEVPHDSRDNTGFFIEFEGQNMTFVTDIGTITDEIAHFISKANHLVIESNYDEEMLRNGSYPFHLKQRITCGTGHISNKEISEFLANNFTTKLRNICLCHLSGDNNNPELAYNTMKDALSLKGIEVGEHVDLHVLKRNELSEKIIF